MTEIRDSLPHWGDRDLFIQEKNKGKECWAHLDMGHWNLFEIWDWVLGIQIILQ
jgi:hypothetical protein